MQAGNGVLAGYESEYASDKNHVWRCHVLGVL